MCNGGWVLGVVCEALGVAVNEQVMQWVLYKGMYHVVLKYS